MATAPQIPPNGFIGGAMQSAAVRNHVQNNTARAKNTNPKRRRKAAPSKAMRASSPRRSKPKGAVILKAGSAAAKAWGKKMKRLRAKAAK